MLDVSGLVSGYGRIRVLHGVDLSVRAGEIVTLIGANGAGKTTLMRCLSGVQSVAAGAIHFDGGDVTRAKPHQRVAMGIIQAPEGRQVFQPLSVEDNLRLGAFRRRGRPQEDLDRIYALFPILAEKRRLAAGGLSGGQQQMLAIGRAMMADPKLLLLDEPSMGLAPVIAAKIFEVICGLRESGATILLVEQNAQAALAIADRAYVLEVGHIVMSGAARDLAADANVRKAYLGL